MPLTKEIETEEVVDWVAVEHELNNQLLQQALNDYVCAPQREEVERIMGELFSIFEQTDTGNVNYTEEHKAVVSLRLGMTDRKYSFTEIAGILNIPVQQVRKMYYLTIEYLRNNLKYKVGANFKFSL